MRYFVFFCSFLSGILFAQENRYVELTVSETITVPADSFLFMLVEVADNEFTEGKKISRTQVERLLKKHGIDLQLSTSRNRFGMEEREMDARFYTCKVADLNATRAFGAELDQYSNWSLLIGQGGISEQTAEQQRPLLLRAAADEGRQRAQSIAAIMGGTLGDIQQVTVLPFSDYEIDSPSTWNLNQSMYSTSVYPPLSAVMDTHLGTFSKEAVLTLRLRLRYELK